MIGVGSDNRSREQGGPREGAAGGSESANRRPYEQERAMRPDMGGECARKHETQKLSETCQVESDGTLGKFNVLPREISEPAKAGSEKSAEVVVGNGNEPVTDRRTHQAEGPKKQGGDLTPQTRPTAESNKEARVGSNGPSKQRWLPDLWLPDGGTGQAGTARFESEEGSKEERKGQTPRGLMEKIVSEENAEPALRAVEKNAGAPGIDGMTTQQLRGHLTQHWPTIKRKLLEGTYAPSPVKRVWLAKADGGRRPLGIPTVMDRFIQQLILGELQALYEPHFSENSWGFRPGRGAHDAVRAAQRCLTEEGKSWVVDMDIKGFFDHMDHGVLQRQLGDRITDRQVLKLIGRYLRAGVWEAGNVTRNPGRGTPQGGPLSPLLANIYLDALDKELEKRELSFSRYADDCNIYVGSEKAAQRVMERVSRFIEKRLKLEVNASKSGVDRPWNRKFLGFRINRDGRIEASPQAVERFRTRVREMWDSRQNGESRELRDQWRRYIRGWWGYYRLAEERGDLKRMDGWIRRHIRKCFWQRWHNPKGRFNALKKLGVKGRARRMASSSRGAWPMAKHVVMNTALSNRRLQRHGFLCFADLTV
jgi:RNA-directed DNA polymerase